MQIHIGLYSTQHNGTLNSSANHSYMTDGLQKQTVKKPRKCMIKELKIIHGSCYDW